VQYKNLEQVKVENLEDDDENDAVSIGTAFMDLQADQTQQQR
jgi:hypothetical protein